MAFLLAFLAACSFALGNVLQQKGDMDTSAGAPGAGFLVRILRRPVWLAGGAMQVAGWIFQAFALKVGALMVVQAVTSLSLVIALPLGAKITNQQVSRRVIIGAVVMVVGTDVLAPAMASSNAVTLFASVIFGVTVFGESLSHGHGRLVPAVIGLALAMVGLVTLAGAKPPLPAEPTPNISHAQPRLPPSGG